jgi:phage terminase large subunit-like protein
MAGNHNGNRASVNGSALARWRRDIVAFITEVLVDPETGEPFKLYPEQVTFLGHAFELTPAGRMRYTELCFSAGKKSGKTGLSAMIVIYTAVVLAGTGGEIYLLANDLEQSQSRVFKAVLLMLQASPLLRRSADITANKITFRSTGTIIQAVANDYQGFSGANPTLNVYDESAYYTSENSRRLWDEGVPSPARAISFRLSVSTAGFDGEPSPLRDLYDRAMAHGEEIAPDLRSHGNFLCYWTHELHAPWQRGEWLEEMRRTLRPVQFRRLIQNEWTSSESQFINLEDWDRCVDPNLRPVLTAADLAVFGGLDCSVRGDHTAMALCTYDSSHKLVRVVNHKVFKPAQGADISFAAVEQLITETSEKFDLRSVSYDPYQCESSAQRLRANGVKMVAFNQTPANLEAATSNLLTLVSERNITSYPSEELRTAIGNCRSIETIRGFRISKIVGSRKIDLAAALSFAALAAVREGPVVEPAIITWYAQQYAKQCANEVQLRGALPMPPADQLIDDDPVDDDGDLYQSYLRGLNRSVCAHCHRRIPPNTTYANYGTYKLHKECQQERRRAGLW